MLQIHQSTAVSLTFFEATDTNMFQHHILPYCQCHSILTNACMHINDGLHALSLPWVRVTYKIAHIELITDI